ncbi:hypothetical protein U1Q18_025509, partial [Sarracenia purpurea var. burkii]
MEETIEGFNKRVVLTMEEEEEVIVEDNITRFNEEKGKLCVVRKLITRKSVNYEALRSTLHSMWKTARGFK